MKEMACKCQDAANNTFSCIRRVSPDFNNIFCIFEDDQVFYLHLYFLNMLKTFRIKNFYHLFQKFIESYDINVDEYQMTNIGYTMKKGLRHRFRKRLKRLVMCQNAECIFAK